MQVAVMCLTKIANNISDFSVMAIKSYLPSLIVPLFYSLTPLSSPLSLNNMIYKFSNFTPSLNV